MVGQIERDSDRKRTRRDFPEARGEGIFVWLANIDRFQGSTLNISIWIGSLHWKTFTKWCVPPYNILLYKDTGYKRRSSRNSLVYVK